jgi:hypothetical protein
MSALERRAYALTCHEMDNGAESVDWDESSKTFGQPKARKPISA